MKSKPKTIKLVYDARMLHNSGIGTQVLNSLKYMTENPDLELTLLGDEQEIHSTFPEFSGEIIPFKAGIYSLQEQFLFPRTPDDAILHIPHYNAPLFFLKNGVVMIHDLIHLQSQEFSRPHYRIYASILLTGVARNAKRILTVSETTRQEFLMRFPGAEKKTSVVYNGIDHAVYKPQTPSVIKDFKRKYNLPKKFLLVVGIGKKHKNVDMVVRALSPLWKSKKFSYPLVLGGAGGVIPEYVQREISHNDVSSFVIPMPRIDLEEMPLLYAAADIFIMPSLLEGFGFPLVEAMAVGTPVLCSNASCLPEIGGGGAVFFDPRNQSDFTQKLMDIIERSSVKEEYREKGIKRSKFFSWNKHVSEIIEIYNELG